MRGRRKWRMMGKREKGVEEEGKEEEKGKREGTRQGKQKRESRGKGNGEREEDCLTSAKPKILLIWVV